jgi:hypothetical protein
VREPGPTNWPFALWLRPATAADGAENLAGGKTRFAGGEQHIEGRKFGRLARSSQRHIGAKLRQFARQLTAAWLQRGSRWDLAPRHSRECLVGHLFGECLGEDGDRALGGRVVQDVTSVGRFS